MGTLCRGLVLLGASLVGCSDTQDAPVSSTQQAIIHGLDDRQDVHAVEEASLRELALESTVALVDAVDLRRGDHDVIELDTLSLRERYGLCEGERFGAQPTLGRCSGTLLDADLVLTAGHCVDQETPCELQLWVFDYALFEPGAPVRLVQRDLYRCRTVALRGKDHSALVRDEGDISERFDYAVVQLDRPVSNERNPVAVSSVELTLGQALTVIGYPNGTPVKIDQGAVVLAAVDAGSPFTLSSDTFTGSSGSGVFDAAGDTIGVLVQGGVDYLYQSERRCFAARSVANTRPGEAQTTGGEVAIRAHLAVTALCDSGWPSESLCARPSACGDGYCSIDEHVSSCEDDCAPIAAFALEAVHSPPGRGCSLSGASAAGTTTLSSAFGAVVVYFAAVVLLALRSRALLAARRS